LPIATTFKAKTVPAGPPLDAAAGSKRAAFGYNTGRFSLKEEDLLRRREESMRKYILLGGSMAAALLLAFLGGMQLGQAQMFDYLTFGNTENEVLVRVAYHDNQVLVKRYRDDNRISIVDEVLGDEQRLAELQQKLETNLSRIPGLDDYVLQGDELTLFKLESVRWEDLLKRVLDVLIGAAN
jgi:hypothetical protein